MSIANGKSPNCTPYWELTPKEQAVIDAAIAESTIWRNGSDDASPALCRKCGQKRLRHNPDNETWCRRCRYTFFNEYFEEIE